MNNYSVILKEKLAIGCLLLLLSIFIFGGITGSPIIEETCIEGNSCTFIESTSSSMSKSVAAYDWESQYIFLHSNDVLIFDYTVSGGSINLHLLSSGQYSTWLSAGPYQMVPTLKSITSTSSGQLTYRASSTSEYYLLFDNQASSSSKTISGTITKDTRAPSIYCNLTNGQNYTSPVTIQINATDDESSVEQITLRIDGEEVTSVDDANTLLYEWDVKWADSGNFTLEISASDGWGKTSTVELNVSISGTPTETLSLGGLMEFLPSAVLILGVVALCYMKTKSRPAKSNW